MINKTFLPNTNHLIRQMQKRIVTIPNLRVKKSATNLEKDLMITESVIQNNLANIQIVSLANLP